MNIYEKITNRILFYLDNMNNDEEFKKNNPNITAQEYLCTKINPNITSKRLIFSWYAPQDPLRIIVSTSYSV